VIGTDIRVEVRLFYVEGWLGLPADVLADTPMAAGQGWWAGQAGRLQRGELTMQHQGAGPCRDGSFTDVLDAGCWMLDVECWMLEQFTGPYTVLYSTNTTDSQQL
jgi:hypothetical protein